MTRATGLGAELLHPAAHAVRIDPQTPGRFHHAVPLLIDQLHRRELELPRELPSSHGRLLSDSHYAVRPPRPPFVGKPKFQTNDELLYALHHELDPVNLEVVDNVLKLACLRKPKLHYDWDFINYIGVINLLRKEYLRHGDFRKVFDLYQSTRTDPRCHRYESLFALLVITIVGTVVGAIIVE